MGPRFLNSSVEHDKCNSRGCSPCCVAAGQVGSTGLRWCHLCCHLFATVWARDGGWTWHPVALGYRILLLHRKIVYVIEEWLHCTLDCQELVNSGCGWCWEFGKFLLPLCIMYCKVESHMYELLSSMTSSTRCVKFKLGATNCGQ